MNYREKSAVHRKLRWKERRRRKGNRDVSSLTYAITYSPHRYLRNEVLCEDVRMRILHRWLLYRIEENEKEVT